MDPLGKSIKRYFSLKDLLIIFLTIVVSITAGFAVFTNLKKEVVITIDNNKPIEFKTMKSTIAEALIQCGISVNLYDYISINPESNLHKIKKNEIIIKRAVPVNITVDGKEIEIMTYHGTVEEALKYSDVKLYKKDKLEGVKLSDKIVRDMTIKIVRVSEELVKEKIDIPFKVVNKPNYQLDKGTQKVVNEGRKGIREKSYRVIYEDGKEVKRELVKNIIAYSPVSRVVEHGTVANFKTSRGDVVRYSKVLDMRATSYTASYEDTGKKPGDAGFGRTATGMIARRGVIAVDPRVIPLGTKVYIEGVGNSPDYGYAIAADTGGAVKGSLIDLYFETKSQCYSWGVRPVKVYILTD